MLVFFEKFEQWILDNFESLEHLEKMMFDHFEIWEKFEQMIFDNVDQPIFFDYIHTNDLGSEIIAEEIYEILIKHI